MPRAPRIYLENCLYYITSVGSYEGSGQSLFYDKEDYTSYLNLLAHYKNEYGFKLFAYTLLPDRLHLLVELRNDVTISTIMHALNSVYTKTYNARYGKKGHLFQERFRSVLVDKDSYLLRLTAHVHACAARKGLVKDPFAYAYTSLLHYMGECHGPLKLDEEVRELFDVLSGTDKVREYERYVRALSLRNKESGGLEKILNHKRVIGSQAFVNRVKDRMLSATKVSAPRRKRPVFWRIPAVAMGVTLLFTTAWMTHWVTASVRKPAVTEPGTKPVVLSASELGERIKGITYEDLEPFNLEASVWDIELTPLHVGPRELRKIVKDRLKFKNQVVVSSNFVSEGFGPSRYTVWNQGPDVMVWESSHRSQNGGTIRWHGEWDGRKLRGFMTQHAAEGISREFSFVGTRTHG